MWTGLEDNVVTSEPQKMGDERRSLTDTQSSLMMMMMIMELWFSSGLQYIQ
jgi:hypothetical protein